MHRGLLLSGVAGVGKTTVASAVGGVLAAAGNITAVVDADSVAQFGPPPGRVPARERSAFYDRLKCLNLAAVWTNYKAEGAGFIVVAGGIDSKTLRERYAGSLTGCDVQLVRLIAPMNTIRERLRRREVGARLDLQLAALGEQQALLDAARIEDFTVVNDRTPAEVAREIVVRAGWLDRSQSAASTSGNSLPARQPDSTVPPATSLG